MKYEDLNEDKKKLLHMILTKEERSDLDIEREYGVSKEEVKEFTEFLEKEGIINTSSLKETLIMKKNEEEPKFTQLYRILTYICRKKETYTSEIFEKYDIEKKWLMEMLRDEEKGNSIIMEKIEGKPQQFKIKSTDKLKKWLRSFLSMCYENTFLDDESSRKGYREIYEELAFILRFEGKEKDQKL